MHTVPVPKDFKFLFPNLICLADYGLLSILYIFCVTSKRIFVYLKLRSFNKTFWERYLFPPLLYGYSTGNILVLDNLHKQFNKRKRFKQLEYSELLRYFVYYSVNATVKRMRRTYLVSRMVSTFYWLKIAFVGKICIRILRVLLGEECIVFRVIMSMGKLRC